MKYTRFEELPVWQTSMELVEGVFELTADRAFRRQGDLANQLQRAGLSISNNIAEGFERGTNAELITFLYYARGSAAEVRSMLLLTDRMPRFSHLASPISNPFPNPSPANSAPGPIIYKTPRSRVNAT